MKKIAILALAGIIAAGLPATAQGNKSQKGTPTPKVEQKKPEKKKRKKDIKAPAAVNVDSIQTAAKGGDATAQVLLGNWYYSGQNGLPQDYTQAAKWYQKAAEQKNVIALGNLGLCYQYGHGVEKDSLQAMKYELTSLVNGNKKFLENKIQTAGTGVIFDNILLANFFRNDKTPARDLDKAVEFYTAAADRGNVPAQRDLGVMLLNMKKGDDAFKWFKKAADNGDPTGQFYAGKMLLFGDMPGQTFPVNPSVGVDYLMHAADQEFPMAYYLLAQAYRDGKGVKANSAKAREYFTKAAIHNHTPQPGNPQYDLAMMLIKGDPADYDMGLNWLMVAVPNGKAGALKKAFQDEEAGLAQSDFHIYMQARRLYEEGQYEEAAKLCKKIEKTVPAAVTLQGMVLLNDKNPKNNPKKAFKLFEKAAKAGDAQALYRIGYCYEKGLGVKADEAKALEYYTASADAGYYRAVIRLGDIAYEGLFGQERDLAKAIALYDSVSVFLNPQAAQRVADAYSTGQGVEHACRHHAEMAKKKIFKGKVADVANQAPALVTK